MNTPLLSLPAPDQIDDRRRARALYWAGWRISRIAEEIGAKKATVFAWKYRGHWDEISSVERVDETLEMRLILLIAKEKKEGCDYKEIDLLARQLERTARVKKYLGGGNETDLNPNQANKNKVPHKKPVSKNYLSPEQIGQINQAFRESLFGYQQAWAAAGEKNRIRNILKSRQIGATWYFAREALVDALATGRNQIFLSASKAQANVFREYICAFVRDATGVELSGKPIRFENGACLYFLGTNIRTAQSYHGNLYMDEYFWIQKFQELRKVSSGMAMHSKWRQTYFSTPSSMSHEAYPFWSGALYNRGRKKEDRISLDLTHAALQAGRACADGQWRQIVNIEDAIAGGCTLFDLEQLKREYSADEYGNLLMCLFVDDTASVFPLALLMRAMVDSWEVWHDFRPFYARPFGDQEVWVGYDPSLSGDSAGLVVIAPPAAPGGKFRLLERAQFRGMDFQEQADAIRKITQRYAVGYIGIDVTGVGQGVYQIVRNFYPAAEEIKYSVDKKVQMILKALDVMSNGRFEFDAGMVDVAQSFMAIRKTMTESGRQLTFKANRAVEVSHADLAWACMHALSHEPLAVPEGGAGASRIEIFG